MPATGLSLVPATYRLMTPTWNGRRSAIPCCAGAALAAVAFLAWWTALGCSHSSDEASPEAGDAGADGSTADAAQGDPDVLIGTFLVEVNPSADAQTGDTTVFGKVYDGPTPPQYVWEEKLAEGDCRLLEPRVPFCAESCGGSAMCVEDDTCQAYPTAHAVGTVTVTGIRTQSGADVFSMDPVNSNYQNPSAVIAWPPFDAGDAVRFDAVGSDFASAFSLQAWGVAPMALTGDALTLAVDTPLEVHWDAGGDEHASIHVKLDISHHGGTKGMVVCDAADSGALTISSALVTQLLGLGAAGFPTIVVTRQSTGSALLSAGRVDLTVSATVEAAVQVPGVVSCSADGDCPDGQTCQKDYTCS